MPPAHADLVVAKEGLLAERAERAERAAVEGERGGGDGGDVRGDYGGVWTPPRGGLSRRVIKKMVDAAADKAAA